MGMGGSVGPWFHELSLVLLYEKRIWCSPCVHQPSIQGAPPSTRVQGVGALIDRALIHATAHAHSAQIALDLPDQHATPSKHVCFPQEIQNPILGRFVLIVPSGSNSKLLEAKVLDERGQLRCRELGALIAAHLLLET